MNAKRAAKPKAPALLPPIRHLSDLANLGKQDERYHRLAIVAASNLGGPNQRSFRAALLFLEQYVGSLVGEYGMPEGRAFREVIDEVNGVRDCIDHVPASEVLP